ncbi:MAG: hypothetical protein QW103_00735 [Candidatus Pacearchaeota archaeon]
MFKKYSEKIKIYEEEIKNKFNSGIIDENYIIRLVRVYSLYSDFLEVGKSRSETIRYLREKKMLRQNEDISFAEAAYYFYKSSKYGKITERRKYERKKEQKHGLENKTKEENIDKKNYEQLFLNFANY